MDVMMCVVIFGVVMSAFFEGVWLVSGHVYGEGKIDADCLPLGVVPRR